MDSRKYMLLVNGQDKTDSVASFHFQDGMCEVIYANSPKAYHYRAEKVQLLKVQSRINPSDFIITVDGDIIQQVDEILDFGPFYRFLRTGKKALTYPKGQVELQENCLTNQKQADIFEYFKETAAAVSLIAEGGLNILSAQYERIKSVSDVTVLSRYLDSSKKPAVRVLPEAVIYPFGLNQSQKTAVEKALSSQVSIIQGPPGTGKTQTILNIISNAVRNGQTVAVVSNNNSATLNVAEKLEKKGLSFLTAFLGSRANKEHFLEAQTAQYSPLQVLVISSLWEISSSFPMCWTAKTSRTARQSGRGILSRRSTISLPTVCSPPPLPHGRRLPLFSCGNTIAAIPRSSISAIRNSTVGSSSS